MFTTLVYGSSEAELKPLVGPVDETPKSEWIHLTKKEGVDIFSKEEPGSSIRALRAEGLISAKIDKIVTILRDVDHATEWMKDVKIRKYVKNISDTEAILYDVTEFPWPLQNRDTVVHHKLVLNDDQMGLTLNFASVDVDFKDTESDKVRVQATKGAIELFPKGDKTYMRLTILVDPMGGVPKWVVNLVGVKVPFLFFKGLDEFAQKTKLEPLPGIQDLLNQIIDR